MLSMMSSSVPGLAGSSRGSGWSEGGGGGGDAVRSLAAKTVASVAQRTETLIDRVAETTTMAVGEGGGGPTIIGPTRVLKAALGSLREAVKTTSASSPPPTPPSGLSPGRQRPASAASASPPRGGAAAAAKAAEQQQQQQGSPVASSSTTGGAAGGPRAASSSPPPM